MTIQILDSPNLSALAAVTAGNGRTATGGDAGTGAVDFSQFLKPNDAAADRRPPTRQQTALRAAQQLVSTTLVKPILSQMRQDPFRVKMFHGGQAEDMFGSQLDTILADRITSRTNFSVVGAVEKEITRTTGRGPTVPTAAAAGQYLPTTSGVHIDANG